MIINNPKKEVSGLLLAGGQARRMGGQDKGLMTLDNKPLAGWGLDRLRPQVHKVMISANRNHEQYQALGAPVISDDLEGFAGPLAGFLSALAYVSEDWMVTAPCDSPLVERDYVEKMCAAITADTIDVAVAHDGERLQPVFTLLHKRIGDGLKAFLERGERKIDLWLEQVSWRPVDFSNSPNMFLNANTPEELANLQRLVQAQ